MMHIKRRLILASSWWYFNNCYLEQWCLRWLQCIFWEDYMSASKEMKKLEEGKNRKCRVLESSILWYKNWHGQTNWKLKLCFVSVVFLHKEACSQKFTVLIINPYLAFIFNPHSFDALSLISVAEKMTRFVPHSLYDGTEVCKSFLSPKFIGLASLSQKSVT